MVRDRLSEELKEAGGRLLYITDVLQMGAQGAMWVYDHNLNDWRYYLVTSLVDTIGRRETYKRLLRIFGAPEADKFFPKELTIEDIHLGSPSDQFFQLITSAVSRAGSGHTTFKDCVINGIRFDGLVYRVVRSIPNTREAKTIEKQFLKRTNDVNAGKVSAEQLIAHGV